MVTIGDKIIIIPDNPVIIGNTGLILCDNGTVDMSAPFKGSVKYTSANSSFSTGDKVLFQKGVGLNILIDGEEKALIMREDQIEGILFTENVRV
jgi:co-chaperonin GroES (HSP10)